MFTGMGVIATGCLYIVLTVSRCNTVGIAKIIVGLQRFQGENVYVLQE
jgi:hypothetical protein